MSPLEKTDCRPARTPTALWRVLDGCAVIFHEETGRAFALNETATRVWEMCDGGVTLKQIVESHARADADKLESARESVERLLGQLADEGFIVMEDAARNTPATGETDAPSPPNALAAPGSEWIPPVAEEIRFAACDCSGGGLGNIRNLNCIVVSPGQAS